MPPDPAPIRDPIAFERTYRAGFKAGALEALEAVRGGARADDIKRWIDGEVSAWVADAARWGPGNRVPCPRPRRTTRFERS